MTFYFVNTVQNIIRMNKIGGVMCIALRAYARNKNHGIGGKLKMFRGSNKDVDKDSIEDCDFDDMDEFESDFMNLDISHAEYEKEQVQAKDLLKNRITRTKYFKRSSPNLLTFAEKEQIRTLHSMNPEEWTVEKLSEGFPALPYIIKKVIKSKWSPQSVDKVMKHDEVVAKNWEQFRAGKLSLSPELQTHLLKFKDRKIILENREALLERLVPQKLALPKPQSTLFMNVIKSYVNENDNTCIAKKETLQRCSKSTHNLPLNITEPEKDIKVPKFDKDEKKWDKIISTTFNDFVKKRLEKLYEGSPEEAITLLSVYRKELENETPKYTEIQNQTISSIQHKLNATNIDCKNNETSKHPTNTLHEENVHDEVMENSKCDVTTDLKLKTAEIMSCELQTKNMSESKINPKSLEQSVLTPSEKTLNTIDEISESKGLDTCIKTRHKKVEDTVDYALPIKIPKNLYKEGMTYRVKDCYYDDNGEFLYRVPGLRG